MKWQPPSAAPASGNYKFPAFAPIVSDAFEHLKCLPQGTPVGMGVFVVEQGHDPSSIYLLRQGLVKLIYTNPYGRETMLGLRAAGWYAGAVSVLMKTPSIYSVKTVTPCVFSTIAADEFSMKLMGSARMARHFMDTLCNEIISQSAEAQLRLDSAETRLAHFMAERSVQHPQLQTLDTLPLLKQMELAQLLAISPEHLSRLLHKTAPARTLAEAKCLIESEIDPSSHFITRSDRYGPPQDRGEKFG